MRQAIDRPGFGDHILAAGELQRQMTGPLAAGAERSVIGIEIDRQIEWFEPVDAEFLGYVAVPSTIGRTRPIS